VSSARAMRRQRTPDSDPIAFEMRTSGQGRQLCRQPLAADGLRRHPRMTSQNSHACRLPGLFNAPANDVPLLTSSRSPAILSNSPLVRCLCAHGGRFPGRRLARGSARRALVGRPPIEGRRQEAPEPNPTVGKVRGLRLCRLRVHHRPGFVHSETSSVTVEDIRCAPRHFVCGTRGISHRVAPVIFPIVGNW
jgi:hypothetical protein